MDERMSMIGTSQSPGVPGARQSQVGDAMQRLEKAIARLREVRDAVENRLGSVLGSIQPEPGTDATNQPSNLVPLAGELKRITDQIEDLAAAEGRMLNRIEL